MIRLIVLTALMLGVDLVVPAAAQQGIADDSLLSRANAGGSVSNLSVSSIATLKALTTRPSVVTTSGYHRAEDGGGGPSWIWYPGDASPIDNCSVVSPTSGTAGRYKRDLSAASDPRWCGARGTTVILDSVTLSISSRTGTLTVDGGMFNASDVGKQIRIPGAGGAGGLLSTSIATVISATQVTLATNASTTLAASATPIVYGYDDTVAIQTSMTASHTTNLSCGNYFVTASLTIGANRAFLGASPDCTRLVRTDAYSHTVRSSNAVAAGGVTINNIWFLEPQNYRIGVTTTLPFASAAGAAHIWLAGGQGVTLKNNRYYYMPYGVLLNGTTTAIISESFAESIWDPANANLQEGLATIRLQSDGNFGATKDIKIIDNRSFGGLLTAAESVNISTTCGVVPVSMARTIGAKYGIWANDAEEVLVSGNYFGAHAYNNIYMNVTGVVADWRVTGNFFDGSSHLDYNIRIDTASASVYALDTVINSNVFNGQAVGRGGLYVDNPRSNKSAYSLAFTGNVLGAHIATPIQLLGADGVTLIGNQVTSYNWMNLCATDPQIAAGLYVGGVSDHIHTSSNGWGGGGNDVSSASPPNYTEWGIYAAVANKLTSIAEANNGVRTALFGGAATNVQSSSTGQNMVGPVSVSSGITSAANFSSFTANDTDSGAPATFASNKYTILAGPALGGDGNLVASYNSATHTAYISALQPGGLWRDLSLNPGGTTTAFGLTVMGDLTLSATASAAQTNILCYNSGSGVVTYQSWASGCAASSARLKEEIETISPEEALRIMMALQPVSYRYRADVDLGSERHLGFLAEQVEAVSKDLIIYEPDGVTPRAVRYQELAPIIVGALQELKAVNDNLRLEIEQLKAARR